MKSRARNGPFFLKKYVLIGLGFFMLFALMYYLHLIQGITMIQIGPKYQWKPEFGDLNGPDISAHDPRVITKILRKYLVAPPKTDNYNLNQSLLMDPSMGQSTVIRRLFKDRPNPGFFVECGALDGETRSNTLFLERFLHWKGLLIEADPANYQKLVQKRRLAWISPTCLSTHPYPAMVSFQQNENQGKIAEVNVGYVKSGYVDVQCFPFESMMIAMNVSTIDYFSLDVEGAELDILRTIPFDKLDIKTLSVEFIHDAEGKDAIRKHMELNGYIVHSEVTHHNWLANDFIFVKKSFYDNFSDNEKENIRSDILRQKEDFSGNIAVGNSELSTIKNEADSSLDKFPQV